MAFSSAKVDEGFATPLKIAVFSWNAASVTSGTIKTGFSVIHSVVVNNLVSEGQGLAVPSGGDVALSSVVSNDTGTLTVIGR